MQYSIRYNNNGKSLEKAEIIAIEGKVFLVILSKEILRSPGRLLMCQNLQV